MELKITDLKASSVQANFEYTFVRVYSGDLYGTGEAGHAPGLSSMQDGFRKLLVGEDALRLNRIEQKIRYSTLSAGTTTYHFASAVNIAIHDLVAKALNVPVFNLLGGDRQEIRIYADAHGGKGLEAMSPLLLPQKLPWIEDEGPELQRIVDPTSPVHGRLSQENWNENYTPASYSHRAKELADEGFTALKFDLDVPTPTSKEYNLRSGDLSSKDIEYMVSLIEEVRGAVGDLDIMVDLHWRYNLNTAIRVCRALDHLGLRWIEDPVPAQMTISNFDELELLAKSCSTPIQTGENLYTRYQFKDLIATGVRSWAPDLTKAGGISEGKRIAELAAMYDIEYSPHNVGSPIATLAQAHAASASNTLGVVEFHGHDLPFWHDFVKPRITMDKGFVRLTDRPGLGVELDEKSVKKLWPNFQI